MQRVAKKKIIKKYGLHEGDTGSSQVQIAILTTRINDLTGHLKTHKKDNHSRRGLMKLVGKRRSHLQHLKSQDEKTYEELLDKLKLRK